MFEDNRPCEFLITRFGKLAGGDDCIEDFFVGPGGKDVITFGREDGKNLDYLVDCLARAVDDLRQAAADLAMMVNVGKAEALKGEMPQLLDRFVNGKRALFDLLKQLF